MPLYFDNLSEVRDLITEQNIKKSFEYLINVDKSRFTINKFLGEFMNSNIVNELRNKK